MAGAIVIEGLDNVQVVTPPESTDDRSTSGDYCVVCGEALVYGGRGKHPTRCAEHKSGSVPKTTNSGRGRGGKGAAASESEWDDFSQYVLIGATYLFARFLAGGQGLLLRKPTPMPEAEFENNTNYLAMEKEEAEPIAKLIAKRVAPTGFNKKYGRHVVSLLDYEEVGMAIWSYGERVGPAVAMRMKSPKVKSNPAPKLKAVPTPAPKKGTTNGSTRPLSNREAATILRQQRPTEQGATEGSE